MNCCRNCARLILQVNTDVKFCVDKEGICYLVNTDWYMNNDCTEKCDKFEIEGRDWR